jgi:hypothetical protein
MKGEGMKTAEEKAKEWCDRYNLEEMQSRVTLLLKEQDRDTRHACAEAVVLLHGQMNCGQEFIRKDSAHAACMNAKDLLI